MNYLWAPWRVKYIRSLKKKAQGCIFCRMLKEKNDKKNYIVSRTRYCFTVMNIYPYNNGHMLIVPYRHVNELGKLSKEEREDLFDLLETTKKRLDYTLRPNGYNIGANIGRVAGAGFPGHLHIHLVPRWKGDVNFMPIIGGTKVISQSLQALFKRLSRFSQK